MLIMAWNVVMTARSGRAAPDMIRPVAAGTTPVAE
jgi:hypothetical protein